MLAYVRAGPTFTGLSLLTPLRMCSKANTNKPKKNVRKICIFSTLSIMKDELIALHTDIRVALLPENNNTISA